MATNVPVRWGWLKAMYACTVVVGGGFGLVVLFFPALAQSLIRIPAQDLPGLGLYGSFALASGLVAILALRSPLKFVPLLLIQLVYKPVWLAVVAVPMFLKGQFPFHVLINSAIFLAFIIGDLIAIPFPDLFAKK